MMTREEAIDIVIKVFDTLEGECNIEYDWNEEHNARDMAIKALEQESVLNKIRAEIEDLTYYCCEVHPRTVIDDVLDIIDKYKAESNG
jgi:hypothetical protein